MATIVAGSYNRNVPDMHTLKKYLPLLFAAGIIALFFFLRVHNLEQRLIFNWDQENYSNQIRELLVEHKPTLLGPRANNDKGFFLAPYFTYLLTPFYLATNLHPIATAYFIIFYNTLFLLATFFVLKSLKNTVFAGLFMLLWATNYVLVGYDTIAWWPIVIPLGSVLAIYALKKIYDDQDSKVWHLLLGVLLGFFLNHHFQFVFVCMYCAIFLIAQYVRKRSIPWIPLVLLIAGFMVMFTPLFLFDIRHGFLNLKLFVAFFQPSANSLPKDVNVWVPVFYTPFKPLFLGALSQYPIVGFLTFLAISIYHTVRKQSFFRLFYISLSILLVVVFFAFRFYGQRPSEYYFIFLYPFVLIAVLDLLWSFPYRQVVLTAYIGLFVFQSTPVAYKITAPDAFALYQKDRAMQRLVKEVDISKQFNISFDAPPNQDTGYRYLLNIYNVKQSGNPADPLIEVRIPPQDGDVVEGPIGLRIPKELRR